jgi:hypothetical protein
LSGLGLAYSANRTASRRSRLDYYQMVDTSLTGMRCRATKEISSHQGLVRRYSEGIIQYDMNNLGRHLISVQWENGVIDYVYPLEIEILGQREESDIPRC